MKATDSAWVARRFVTPKRETDVRSEWERDYARLIHSSAFRRLQSKTQVIGLGESDFYRTRLTHSMEVAQIGSGISRWLAHFHGSRNECEIVAALPDQALISSICLAHDIGHPPFGHGGEVALNLCMRSFGGFEGNGQTLRILARLDKYSEAHGLNPTRRLMFGILKYPSPYSSTVVNSVYGPIGQPNWLFRASEQHPPKCYLDEEKDVVDWILEPLSASERNDFIRLSLLPKEGGHYKTLFKGLDTSIMELADDISYGVHDLEDAISLRIISREDWVGYNAGKEETFKACGLDSVELGDALFSGASHTRKEVIGKLVNKFITQARIGTAGIASAVTDLIRWNARLDEAHQALLSHVKDFVFAKVIRSSNVQQLEFKGQKLVVELFTALSSDPERLLPERARQKYRREGVDEQTRARLMCDFIAGMTDEYAIRLYEKLFDPHKGSVFDRL